MIELRDTHFRYAGSDWILKGLNLDIERGEYILVCGANGSGKSTLSCLLNGLIPHFIDGELSGSVKIDGFDTRNLSVADIASRVGLVLQNAEAQLFHSTVADDIAFGLETLDLSAAAIDAKVKEMAKVLSIGHLLDCSPGELSGGEKRLAAIAATLVLGPSVVVLDEPFADLDGHGVELVRKELRHIHRSGKTVVVIEQRLEGALDDATRCLILQDGRLFFDGVPEKAFSILHSKRLIPTYPQRSPRHFDGERAALVVKDLRFNRERRDILHEISFEIKRGESVAVVGRNGSGKTTLIKHFNGLNRPSSGTAALLGETAGKRRTDRLAARVGLSFQNPNDQFFKTTVREELSVGPKMIGTLDDQWIERICAIFELNDLLDRSPYRLSEGEKKRVALASVFAMKASLVVLDEPTVGQDGRFRESLAGFLRVLEEYGFTLIIVTHDFDFARAVSDRWIALENGRVVADGPPRCVSDKLNDSAEGTATAMRFDDTCGKTAHG